MDSSPGVIGKRPLAWMAANRARGGRLGGGQLLRLVADFQLDWVHRFCGGFARGCFAVLGVFNARVQHIQQGIDKARFDLCQFLKSQWALVQLVVRNPLAEDVVDQFLNRGLRDLLEAAAGSFKAVGKENNRTFLEGGAGAVVAVGALVDFAGFLRASFVWSRRCAALFPSAVPGSKNTG